MAQLGKAATQLTEQRQRAMGILDVGRVNLAGDHESFGVRDDVALAALNSLAGADLKQTAASVVGALWLSMMPLTAQGCSSATDGLFLSAGR